MLPAISVPGSAIVVADAAVAVSRSVDEPTERAADERERAAGEGTGTGRSWAS